MRNDPFWKFKIDEYCKAFAFFHKTFTEATGIHDSDVILAHWTHLTDTVCDCEGCREDEDCTVHIGCEEDDTYSE